MARPTQEQNPPERSYGSSDKDGEDVADLALALTVIGGPDWRDPSVAPVPLGGWQAVDPRKLRVAFYTSHADAQPTAETAAVCRAVAGMFATAPQAGALPTRWRTA
jgi:Asp-tRNA(Asn)/Glu-tRNA(Gln) amidotransferase A subunit family amidase